MCAGRAVALGLNADDVLAVDHFIEELKEKKMDTQNTRAIKSMAEKDALKLKVMHPAEQMGHADV